MKRVLIALTLVSHFAHSYLLGSFSERIDYNKPTHFFFIGYSGGMGNLFVTNALIKAQKIQRIHPQRQFVFFYQRDYNDQRDHRRFSIYGVNIVEEGPEYTSDQVVAVAERFRSLTAMEFSSHANGWSSGIHRNTRGLAGLRNNFSENAYVVFHGCNAGYGFAPYVSELWGVPAFGALTGSDFQHQSREGVWYFNNPWQHPENVRWKWNQGHLWTQMRAQNAPYRGKWG